MEFKLEHTKIDVKQHPNKTYCVLTLQTVIDGNPVSEAIALDTDFFLNQSDVSLRKSILENIISKLTSDVIIKHFVGIESQVKDSCDIDSILSQIEDLQDSI
jgi:hypothetical protein